MGSRRFRWMADGELLAPTAGDKGLVWCDAVPTLDPRSEIRRTGRNACNRDAPAGFAGRSLNPASGERIHGS
jgi:hypothetical protein